MADPRTTSVIAGSRLDLLEALDALERLHSQLLAPVVLRDFAGLSYAEVAPGPRPQRLTASVESCCSGNRARVTYVPDLGGAEAGSPSGPTCAGGSWGTDGP